MSENLNSCPFCAPLEDRVFWRGRFCFAIWDNFPVNPGHALIIPYRHVQDWFSATDHERRALARATYSVREIVMQQFPANGWNIGVNVGETGGQTVFHLHVHLIPRLTGDVADPRGGVRGVIPNRKSYECFD